MGSVAPDGGSSPLATAATTRASSLSPDADPFHPSCSDGRTKSRRWTDEDGEESDDDCPTTYLDAVRRPGGQIGAASMMGRAGGGPRRHGSRVGHGVTRGGGTSTSTSWAVPSSSTGVHGDDGVRPERIGPDG
ncbi:hypothetical protein C2845_PM09G13140 [Panicum miliaceum]|uniref:Uncharacterized protein n=1 Tax=Panicum miliaceum TaxID=4540 RepID=A0A3L6RZ58_PANMI|nr:hypothetical protein C2845_PM09G13140 [Panicum miliaceum]